MGIFGKARNEWSEGFNSGIKYGIEKGEVRAANDLDNLLKIRNAHYNSGYLDDAVIKEVNKRILEWLKRTA